MPYANKEQRREYARVYYSKYRKSAKHGIYIQRYQQRRTELNKQYYIKNRQTILKNLRDYRANNADRLKERKIALKLDVFAAYGGAFCVKCGESRLSALTLDHIAQDGAKHRNNGRPWGITLYRQLRRQRFPNGFRVLCSNCNILVWLQYRDGLPRSTTKSATHQRERAQFVKSLVMSRLGNKCIVCGIDDVRILTVHHTLNNGAMARKVTGGRGGNRYYEHLIKTNDLSNLECRCFSCNDADAWK